MKKTRLLFYISGSHCIIFLQTAAPLLRFTLPAKMMSSSSHIPALSGFNYQWADDGDYPAQACPLGLQSSWKWDLILSGQTWRESEGSLAFHLTLCWCRPLGKWPREGCRVELHSWHDAEHSSHHHLMFIFLCGRAAAAGPYQIWRRIRRFWLNSEAFC